jgi:hypothetical protein
MARSKQTVSRLAGILQEYKIPGNFIQLWATAAKDGGGGIDAVATTLEVARSQVEKWAGILRSKHYALPSMKRGRGGGEPETVDSMMDKMESEFPILAEMTGETVEEVKARQRKVFEGTVKSRAKARAKRNAS